MANTSDSNNILKTILIIIVVVAIAYIIYYLYTQNTDKPVTKKHKLESYTNSSDNYGGVHVNKPEHVPKEKEYFKANTQKIVEEPFESEVPRNMPQMNSLPQFPKDQLTADELLPKDNSSLWAQVNPSGEGSLKDRNFLQSGYHIGINTVGQTLRNGNLQLRSEPPCPQVRVSPWLQSTIEPDLGRKPFEIGGCA